MIALYHFITFITLLHLSLYRFIAFITSLLFDEETLPPPSHYRYGLWLGLFSFCTRHCGSFAGYAYLVRVVLSGFKCLPFVADSSIDLVFTLAGIWAANCLEASWGEDPSRVVVDEMVGVWIALLAAPAGHVWYALGAFVLFRLFDIFKPLGIRRMESLPGGIGVMMDDILSGVYGFIILIVARWIIS